MVTMRYPFLISVPHGGIEVPPEVSGRLALGSGELSWYCDPGTRTLFDFGTTVEVFIDTPVSRMVVDLNRPPLPLPPHDPDGIIKVRTIDGRSVYLPGQFPDIALIHQLLMKWYFPFHQQVDDLIDRHGVAIAFDCHSMLPVGSREQKDAGSPRPLICLGNNGDSRGRPRKNSIATCPVSWVTSLADAFREEFSLDREVAINNPFSGGFISNAHYWRKGVPWVQVEINRSLYEPGEKTGNDGEDSYRNILRLREKIWMALTCFWENAKSSDVPPQIN